MIIVHFDNEHGNEDLVPISYIIKKKIRQYYWFLVHRKAINETLNEFRELTVHDVFDLLFEEHELIKQEEKDAKENQNNNNTSNNPNIKNIPNLDIPNDEKMEQKIYDNLPE